LMLTGVEAVALIAPSAAGIETVLERHNSISFDDMCWQLVPLRDHCTVYKVTAAIYSTWLISQETNRKSQLFPVPKNPHKMQDFNTTELIDDIKIQRPDDVKYLKVRCKCNKNAYECKFYRRTVNADGL